MSVIRIGNPLSKSSLTKDIVRGLQSTVKLRRTHLFASDAGYCHRKSALVINCDPEMTDTIEAAGALYMGIGSAIHEALGRALKRAGTLLGQEVRVEGFGLGLGGYIDLVAMVDGQPTIIEIKTCGALPSRPKPWHYEQAMVYSLVTGIRNPVVLYASRNVADYSGKLVMQPLTIEATEVDYRTIAIRLFLSYHYSQRGLLGQIPDHIKTERDCSFCPFKPMCWGSVSAPISHATPKQNEEILRTAIKDAEKLITDMDGHRETFLKSLKSA